ncbi:substrate-binding periplasmic protein [Thalassotalea euphylliae]|uniref:substrate-binding periplasmic protein n=1 Tax=Thalassotalea euphylliae TaxID=1655234 RepID=UPI0036443037
MKRLIYFLCGLFCSYATANGVVSAPVLSVPVYSYHLKPPLIIDDQEQKGLYFDFVNYLNSSSKDYQFQLTHIPRKRIDKMLAEKELDGILLGVNPVWFKDKQETKYLWSPRIFTDRDELVSLKETPVEYINPDSLEGKVFGGVRGFYYFGINEIIKQQRVLRIDTVHEIDLFSMLLNRRIDAAVISRSTFDYMVKINEWQDKFHLSKKPHDIYDRRVLIPLDNEHLYHYLLPIISQMEFDEQWQSTLAKYR